MLEYADAGFAVIGVAIDEPDAVADFLKTERVEYPILIGDDDTLKTAGDSAGVLPYSLLIGPDGKMITLRAGSFQSAGGLDRWIAPHLRNPG